jgi:hypothetical protein
MSTMEEIKSYFSDEDPSYGIRYRRIDADEVELDRAIREPGNDYLQTLTCHISGQLHLSIAC